MMASDANDRTQPLSLGDASISHVVPSRHRPPRATFETVRVRYRLGR